MRTIAAGIRRNWIGIAAWIVVVGGWEVASHIVAQGSLKGSPRVPSIAFIFSHTLKSLSESWTVHWWAPTPITGGKETYLGAVLAIGYHSYFTLKRVLLGLVVGMIVGVGTGIVVSYSKLLRQIAWGPLNFLRMVPLLAAIPLFEFWFGASTKGTTIFIGFGVWVLVVVATINAIGNVPNAYAESARTLGASRLQTYRRVIVPRALPELRTALLLSAGLSWSLAIGSEYLGTKTGLGTIMATAQTTANTGRLVIIAIIVILYALTTFAILNRIFSRFTRWEPRPGSSALIGVASAGAAAVVHTSDEEMSAV